MGFRKNLVCFGALAPLLLGLVGCVPPTAVDQARLRGYENARTGNTVERRHYDMRRDISQDPTTVLWCTFAFPHSGSELVTIPIVGKLTSGGKRSFGQTGEEPDEYGMYGSSDSQYRYGFGPGGKAEYSDFNQMPMYCTTVAKTYQVKSTALMQPDEKLNAAALRVRELLRAGKPDEASAVLGQAIREASVNPR